MKFWILCLVVFFGSFAWAQKPYAYRAEIISPEVHIFQQPSFEAPVVATVIQGNVFDVSQKPSKGFYRIRIKPGTLGYVSEADVRPLFGATAKKNAAKKKSEKDKDKELPKKNLSFQHTLFAGFKYALLNFTEKTMGSGRSEQLGFFGAKLSGPDLIVEGAFPTEVNFMMHMGAPSYYEKLTGYGADGWVFIGNFLWQNYYPHGKNALTFLGFGPMYRYSKFRTQLLDPSTGKSKSYLLDDMSLGAVFNAGVSLRINKIALRGDVQYYWEEQKYWGTSLAVQFGF